MTKSRTNEKQTTIQEFDDASVKVNYFSIEDEDLTPCGQAGHLLGGWIHCKVRIDLLEFTEWTEALERLVDFKIFQLYVNDEFIGELINVRDEATPHGIVLFCSVVVDAS